MIGIIIQINHHEPIFRKQRLQAKTSYKVLVDGKILETCPPRWFVMVGGYTYNSSENIT